MIVGTDTCENFIVPKASSTAVYGRFGGFWFNQDAFVHGPGAFWQVTFLLSQKLRAVGKMRDALLVNGPETMRFAFHLRFEVRTGWWRWC